MVAEEFKTSIAYAVGDFVLYDGQLYRFKSAHSAGAWNSSQVDAVDTSIEQQLTSILSAYERANSAVSYAGKIVFSPSQISGDRYQYTFMNA